MRILRFLDNLPTAGASGEARAHSANADAVYSSEAEPGRCTTRQLELVAAVQRKQRAFLGKLPRCQPRQPSPRRRKQQVLRSRTEKGQFPGGHRRTFSPEGEGFWVD